MLLEENHNEGNLGTRDRKKKQRRSDSNHFIATLLLDGHIGSSSPTGSPLNSPHSPRHNRCFSTDVLNTIRAETKRLEEEGEESPEEKGEGFPIRRKFQQASASLIFSVGDYSVLEKLGKGGAGTVYLAHHATTGHAVAIKMTDKKGACTGNRSHDPSLEAKILALLKHKHINKLVEVKENEHRVCMVMEYAKNGDMLQYLQSLEKDCFEEAEAKRIFRQVISAVAYLHLQGFAHRDIKPENIFFDDTSPTPNAFLGDFSLACEWSAHRKKQKEVAGTFEFSAPETLVGPCCMGPEADIWSCGVLLYFMLCGRLPFQASDPMGVLRKMLRGKWVRLGKTVSKPVKKLIAGMLEPNPLKRINMIDIMGHAWLRKDIEPKTGLDAVLVQHRKRSYSADMSGSEENKKNKKERKKYFRKPLPSIKE